MISAPSMGAGAGSAARGASTAISGAAGAGIVFVAMQPRLANRGSVPEPKISCATASLAGRWLIPDRRGPW